MPLQSPFNFSPNMVQQKYRLRSELRNFNVSFGDNLRVSVSFVQLKYPSFNSSVGCLLIGSLTEFQYSDTSLC